MVVFNTKPHWPYIGQVYDWSHMNIELNFISQKNFPFLT